MQVATVAIAALVVIARCVTGDAADHTAHAGTAIALWMRLPLLIGTWRITRREVA